MQTTAQPMTLTELARRMKVSPATVSKALNGRDDVSEQTRKRVLEAAIRYDLRPHAGEGVKRRDALRRIAAVSYNTPAAFGHPPYARLIHAIEKEVRAEGGELIMEFDATSVPECHRRTQVDAMIVIGPLPPLFNAQVLEGALVVCTPDPVGEIGLDCVSQDNTAGTAMITNYLIEAGHRRIAFAAHTCRRQPFVERASGYLQAMHLARLDAAMLTYENERADCIEEMARRLAEGPWTAVVATNDNLACCMVALLGQLGRRVPQDISVVGFDRWPQPSIGPAIPLTTVDGNMEEVGRQAVELLRYRYAQKATTTLRLTVPSILVKGNSVAVPARDRRQFNTSE